jgi:hypothetical protein
MSAHMTVRSMPEPSSSAALPALVSKLRSAGRDDVGAAGCRRSCDRPSVGDYKGCDALISRVEALPVGSLEKQSDGRASTKRTSTTLFRAVGQNGTFVPGASRA